MLLPWAISCSKPRGGEVGSQALRGSSSGLSAPGRPRHYPPLCPAPPLGPPPGQHRICPKPTPGLACSVSPQPGLLPHTRGPSSYLPGLP